MVLDDVAGRAHAVVVACPAAGADVLGHGDLDVVHVVGVPQRLEELVREAQRQDVLHRLLAQVVVDPEDRVRREHRLHDVVELPGRLEVVAERLLDDHAAPLVALGLGQAVLGELPADLLEGLRRDGEVERVVAARSAVLVEFIDGFAEPLEGVVVVELALHEADALGELLPDRLIERGAGVGLDGLLHLRGEVLVVPLPPGEAHQGEARRQQPAVGEVVHGRHELLAGEVAGDPEQDQRRRSGNTVQAAVPRVPQRVARPCRPCPAAVVSFWHGCVGALAFGGGYCLAGQRGDELLELRHAGGAVGEVQAEDRAAVFGQDLGVAGGLGGDQLAEA